MANIIMIIQLCVDDAIRGGVKKLHDLYPGESISSRFGLFNDSTGLASTEDDGSPVERITVISHGSPTEYARVDAATFSQRLIKQLKKLPSEDLSRIHTLDLIGCGNGLIRPDGSGFSASVAEKLSQAGYGHIQVKSFTNMVALEPHPIVELITELDKSGRFIIQGIRTEADERLSMEYDETRKGLREEYNRLGFKLKQLEHSALMPGADQASSIAEMRAVEEQQAHLAQEMIEINARQKALYTVFLETKNPRDVLDKNPQCHFTTRYIHRLGGGKGTDHPIHTAIETDNLSQLERIIKKDPSGLNLTDKTGLTPLFLAVLGNHSSCARALIEQGADVTLQVTYPILYLQTQLASNPTALKRLELLIEKKHITSDNASIPLDAFEMSYVMGYRAMSQMLYQRSLFMAAETGDHKKLADLINLSRASINIQNKDGLTPLSISILRGHTGLADLFIGDDKPPPLESKCTCAFLFAMFTDTEELSRAADLVAKKTLTLATEDVSSQTVISLKASELAEIKGNNSLATRLRKQEEHIVSSIIAQTGMKSALHDIRSSDSKDDSALGTQSHIRH